MGRWRALPLMMSLCLLTACGGGDGGSGGELRGEALALQIQREYAALTGCAAQVRLTADYGEKTFTCTVDVTYDSATGGTLTLVEPEIARGVTARITADGAQLTYDDFSLDAGPVADGDLAPVEAIPTLYRQVSSGYIAAWDQTEEELTVTYRDSADPPGEGLETVVTFSAADHAPMTGELFWDGQRVMTAQFLSFQMMTGETPGGA